MPSDVDAEILELRAVLRDLVALSAIPAAWVGREPLAVAAGLADTLIGLLQLDFVSVRLCDPRVADAVEATWGDAWKTFPEWMERHLATAGRLSATQIVSRVDGAELCRGVVIPIGLDADAGVVAAASDRADFPTVTDQLLLRLAANQAATAFQNACLIDERTRAEEELRKGRDELEVKVAEQTAELAASRVRIVTAADETRRRIERDLHDGVQQRLVSLALEQRTAEGMVPPEFTELQAQLSRVAHGLAGALDELREISRGIHPATLTRGGLATALKTLARRSAVPVELDLRAETRLPGPVEVAAYYVVSEALTNTAKHARASSVHVGVEVGDGVLDVSIRDDGSGGADSTHGSGLVGLADRVDALGGTIEVVSPVGRGTRLLVTLPFAEVESP
jgi:signal transduction histidine kinase